MKNKNKPFLFYLGHPAHYHNVSKVIEQLSNKGYEIILVARKKDVLFDLLRDLPYKIIYLDARVGQNKLALIGTILKREIILFRLVLKYKPRMMVGTDIVITHIGKLFGIPSFVLNEDDAAEVPFLAKFGFKYSTAVFSPNCCNISPYDHKKIGYEGYHELAYLHPDYFKPDKSKVETLFAGEERFFLLRFASLTAHHDEGVKGINDELAKQIISILESKGKVWVTSERPLSPDFEQYRIAIPPTEIHHALFYADLYIGDSQTMAAEAAVLGTPSLRFNDFVGKLSYLEELEHKYQLTFGIKTDQKQVLLDKVTELISQPDLKAKWQERREVLLNETIDVTQFWVHFFESYKL
jgi:hypothetical protein